MDFLEISILGLFYLAALARWWSVFLLRKKEAERKVHSNFQFMTTESAINAGTLVFSKSKFERIAKAYAFNSMLKENRVLVVVGVLFFLPMGFVPAVFFGIFLFLAIQRAEEYEQLISQARVNIKSAKSAPVLSNENQALQSPSHSVANEIRQLKMLMEQGDISEAEFEAMKAKIIQNAS